MCDRLASFPFSNVAEIIVAPGFSPAFFLDFLSLLSKFLYSKLARALVSTHSVHNFSNSQALFQALNAVINSIFSLFLSLFGLS